MRNETILPETIKFCSITSRQLKCFSFIIHRNTLCILPLKYNILFLRKRGRQIHNETVLERLPIRFIRLERELFTQRIRLGAFYAAVNVFPFFTLRFSFSPILLSPFLFVSVVVGITVPRKRQASSLERNENVISNCLLCLFKQRGRSHSVANHISTTNLTLTLTTCKFKQRHLACFQMQITFSAASETTR